MHHQLAEWQSRVKPARAGRGGANLLKNTVNNKPVQL
jgi:hypothetical protein